MGKTGHFPASEDKAGLSTNRKGYFKWRDSRVLRHASLPVPKAARSLRPSGGGMTHLGLCFRELILAAVWRRSWIWERLKAGSPVRRLVP